MYKKLILFNSPLYHESVDDNEDCLPPLGQGYIATELCKNGIDVELIDCVYKRWGVSEIIEYINNTECTHIGFNVFSVNLHLIKEIVENISCDVPIFLGGKAIEFVWQEVVNWEIQKEIIFVIGEGELIIPDIILSKCIEAPIYATKLYKVYRVDKDSAYFPHNLDDILLDRSLFKNRELVNRYGNLESCIITSRGCIYNCAFCGGAKSANPGIKVRARSIQNIKKEIDSILELNDSVKSIRILDDLFLKDKNSIRDAIELFNGYDQLHWRGMAHIRSFRDAAELLEPLKKSGCDELFIGIESGSPAMRKKIHKIGALDEIESVVEALLQVGIDIKGYFICGFPGETEEQLKDTLKLAQKLTDISKNREGEFRTTVFQFRPYHGTELYNEIMKDKASISYFNDEQKRSSKKQYNFSAGNFSAVNDEVLNYYLNAVMNVK